MSGSHDKALAAVHDSKRQGNAEAKVLEEDEFTEQLGKLIERDFYPELRQLRAENAALENGAVFIADTDEANEDAEETDQSLDTFLNTHTSEDNASFKRLLDEENKQRDEKYQQIFGAPSSSTTSGQRLALEGKGVESTKLLTRKDHSQSSGVVASWKYTPRNALMFAPKAHVSQAGGVGDGQISSEKRILHHNTRLPADPDIPDTASIATEASSTVSTAGYSTPLINGYKMVDPDTPSSSTRGFRIMPTPRRELAGRRLANKSKQKPFKRDHASGPAKSPLLLSPAARQLLERTSAGKSPFSRSAANTPDDMLRKSYNSPYVFRKH
ncbi:hypothetical protein GGI12_003751 [Dipsacomyces acuminosporus]|nr:hypothetical protein GGI12_003751 [Dipsacomyces acuminosporus]